MNKPHIFVEVNLGWYRGESAFSFVIPIDESLVRETFRPIDEPKFDAREDAMQRFMTVMLCTPSDVIARVKRNRKDLADAIAREILNRMEKHDTTNGYKRDEAAPSQAAAGAP